MVAEDGYNSSASVSGNSSGSETKMDENMEPDKAKGLDDADIDVSIASEFGFGGDNGNMPSLATARYINRSTGKQLSFMPNPTSHQPPPLNNVAISPFQNQYQPAFDWNQQATLQTHDPNFQCQPA